ncbi:MAG TPA: methyltransferase domain-containing protein [Pirellulales bacterium]|jgi:SAM-dependent methyltransferase|nr:methyltransferase domain-containing protein [Pirellulales bacterium]
MTTESQIAAGNFFHGFADTFDTFYDGKRSPMMQWIDRRFRSDMFIRYELTFSRLGNLAGKRGIDIGCGSGPYVAEALRRQAARVVALDPAPRMLDLTRQRVEKLSLLDRLTTVEGYFPAAAPPGPFDFAIVMGVMDYVAEPVAFLKALRQIMTGTAAISFPSHHWLRTPLRKVRYRLRSCPVYFYDEALLRSIGAEAGFGTVDIVKIPGAGMDFHVCLKP